IDLLGQAPRNVDSLARETGMSVASVSQHLQVLHNAKLVEAERLGNRTLYRLADEAVLRLWLALRSVGEGRLPEIEQILRLHQGDGTSVPVSADELQSMMARGEVLVVDVRPRLEYDSGHLQGAISVPIQDLIARLGELPRDRKIVTYCRGIYCEMSGD